MATDILHDILEQPALLAAAARTHLSPGSSLAAAAATLASFREKRVLLAGMGSSSFACYPPALRLQAAGWNAAQVELAELLHFGGELGPDTLLVLVSQSGETVEARRLLERRPPQGPIIAVTNSPQSTLGRAAAHVIHTGAGDEKTVATRTYTTALLALSLLAELALGAEPSALERDLAPALAAVEQTAAAAPALVDALPETWLAQGPITLMGRGPSLATALSGALLLKETAKIPADGLSTAQFRHGPIEIAQPGHRAVVIAGPGPTRELDIGMAADLRAAGSQVLLLGDAAADAADSVIPIAPVWLAPLAEIIPLQLLARRAAIALGIEPGSFRHIGKVTTKE